MTILTFYLRSVLAPPVLLMLFLLADAVLFALRQPSFAWQNAWPGCLLIATGMLIIITALLQLLYARTTINALRPDKTQRLVTYGLFRYSRNPVYLGFALMLCGAGIAIGSPIAMLFTVLFMWLITVLHIRIEETQLSQTFGVEWVQYASSTRRWL